MSQQRWLARWFGTDASAIALAWSLFVLMAVLAIAVFVQLVKHDEKVEAQIARVLEIAERLDKAHSIEMMWRIMSRVSPAVAWLAVGWFCGALAMRVTAPSLPVNGAGNWRHALGQWTLDATRPGVYRVEYVGFSPRPVEKNGDTATDDMFILESEVDLSHSSGIPDGVMKFRDAQAKFRLDGHVENPGYRAGEEQPRNARGQ